MNATRFKMESIYNVYPHSATQFLDDISRCILFHSGKSRISKIAKISTMPNGYANAMRYPSKIPKPPFSLLRKLGHQSVVYVDGIFFVGSILTECAQNIDAIIDLCIVRNHS